MSRHLRCPQGHEWEATGDGAAACPVCGQEAAARASGPETIAYEGPPPQSQDATLAASVQPPVDDEQDRTLEEEAGTAEGDSGVRGQGRSSPPVPGFEILGVLGRGGMGVVYQARQVRLGRIVALKMILAGSHAGAADLDRFRAEAEAIAALRHPHIVHIYSVGSLAGRPYFVLEYVDGGNLAQKLDGQPRPPADAAGLVELLARGIHAAHQHGIIHRDLKPANVLLTADGTPKIADFGLAKKLDGPARTQTGTVLGTPSYMAPEQAAGKKGIGPATDIYALGAILYELLTGQPPFKAETSLETVLEVISGQVVPPRRLVPEVPRDLEMICLTCLEKEPAQRYRTADDLAEDLRRFRAGEPIRPHLLPWRQRAWKWLRRRPAVLGAAVLLLVALAVVGCLYAGDAYRMASNRGRLTVEAPAGVRVRLLRNGQEVAVLNRHTQMTLEAGDYEAELVDDPEGLELDDPRVTVTRNGWTSLVVRPEQVGEVQHLSGHKGPVCAVGLTPDGLQALSISGLVDGDHTLRRWELSSGKEVQRHSVPGSVLSAAFSPDGRLVVLGGTDGVLRLLDTETGKQLHRIEGHRGRIYAIAFTADGRRALSGGEDRVVRLWDVQTGKKLRELQGHVEEVVCVAVSPDGKQAVSGGSNRALRRWDLEAGRGMAPLRGGQTSTIMAAAFSLDGKHLALGGEDGLIRLWDARTGQPGLRLRGHTRGVTALTFQADGRQLVSVSLDRTVRVWDVASGQERRRLTGHSDGVLAVAVAAAADGRHVLTGGGASFEEQWVKGRDFGLRWWAVPRAHPGQSLQTVEPPGELIQIETVKGGRGLAFSPEGGQILSGAGRESRLWDAETGLQLRTFTGMAGNIVGLAFSSDGRQVWAGNTRGSLGVWEVASGQLLRSVDSPVNTVLTDLAFSADSTRALFLFSDSLVVVDLKNGKTVRLPPLPIGQIKIAALSPDGKEALFGTDYGPVWVLELQAGKDPRALRGHRGSVNRVVFSPDGKQGLSAGFDGTIRLWDLADGDELLCLKGRQGPVHDVAFAPDGRRAISGGEDGTVRLWDLESGQEIHQFQGHKGAVKSVAFAPSGDRVASVGIDQTLRIWQLPAASGPAANGPKCQVMLDCDTPAATLVLKSGGRVVRTLRGRMTGPVSLPADVRYTVEIVEAGLRVSPQEFLLGAEKSVRLAVRRSPEFIGEVAQLHGPPGMVSALTFSAKGDRLLAAGPAGKVVRWDLPSGRELHESPSVGGAILALSPDGRLALVHGPGQLTVWDVPKGKERCRLALNQPVQGPALFLRGGEQVLVAGGQDTRLSLCETTGGKKLHRFEGDSGWVSSLAASADGKWVLSGGHDGIVRLWDASTGAEVRQFLGHRREVFAVDLSADGRLALSAGADGTVRLWDVACGKEVRRLVGHRGAVLAAAFTPDGKGLVSWATGAPGILFWEVSSGRKVHVVEQVQGAVMSARATALFSTGTGASVLVAWSGSDRAVHLWQLPAPTKPGRVDERGLLVVDGEGMSGSVVVRQKGEGVGTFPLPTGQAQWQGLHMAVSLDPGEYEVELTGGPRGVTLSPTHFRLSRGGQQVVAMQRGPQFVGEVRLMRAALGQSRVYPLPDSRHCLTLDRNGVPALLDLESGRKVRSFESQGGQVWSVAVSADGTRAVGVQGARELCVWDVTTGKLLAAPRKPLPSLSGELALFADGKQALAVGGSRLSRIDTSTGEVVGEWSLAGANISNLALSADGRRALLCRSDGSVTLWDVAADKEAASFAGSPDPNRRVAISPDGRLALAWSMGGMIRLWDVESKKELPLPRGGVRAAAAGFSPDSHRLVVASLQGNVRLYDLADRREVHRFLQPAPSSLAFTADGRRLLVAGPSGLALLQLPGPDHPDGQLAVEAPIRGAALAVKRAGKVLHTMSFVTNNALLDLAPGEYELELQNSTSPQAERLSAERVRIRARRVETVQVLPVARPLFTPEPARFAAAEMELNLILARQARTHKDRLRQREDLVSLMRKYPEVSAAQRAVTELARLPSPLDRLEHDTVPAEALEALGDGKAARAPASVVAVLGDLPLRPRNVRGMAVSPDGKLLALHVGEGKLQLWDLEQLRMVRSRQRGKDAVQSLAFSPDGKRLAVGGSDGKVVLWEPTTGNDVRMLDGRQGAVQAVAFSPDGLTLATADSKGTVLLWSLGEGKQVKGLPRPRSPVTDLAFSPDSRVLASIGGGVISLWDVVRGESRKQWYSGTQGLAFSPDGSLLASSGAMGITLWESASGGLIRPLTSAPLEGGRCLAYRPDGREVAAVSSQGRITRWDPETDLQTGELLLPGAAGAVVQIAYSPDGRYLFVCHQVGLVSILRLAPVPDR